MEEPEVYYDQTDLEIAMFEKALQNYLRDTIIGGSSGASLSNVTSDTEAQVQSVIPGIDSPKNRASAFIGFPFTSIIFLLFYFDFFIFSCI